jgi:NAD(P)H-quinone oxidoreductase subunit I
MGAFANYLSGIYRTVTTLGDGLAVTFSYMFSKPVTLQYPDRTKEPVVKMLPERSRGMLEVDMDLCTGCLACARACPIDCIAIDVKKDPEQGRLIHRMDIDLAKCMYCGLCVEACPAEAIRHSHEFEGSMYHVQNLLVSFVDEPRPPAKVKKDEPIQHKPVGSILRSLLPASDAPARKWPSSAEASEGRPVEKKAAGKPEVDKSGDDKGVQS